MDGWKAGVLVNNRKLLNRDTKIINVAYSRDKVDSLPWINIGMRKVLPMSLLYFFIMASPLSLSRKLPNTLNSHAHRSRDDGDDVMDDDDFYEGSTDSAYRMTSYDSDLELDRTYLTECQKQRLVERSYNVSCLDDGSYNSSQCHHETRECWCVDHHGEEIPGTIRMLPTTPRCQEKVRPTFTLTLVTPSPRQPPTINYRPIQEVGNSSPNHHQLGHGDLIPSEDTITYKNQLANHSWDGNDDGDGDDDDHNHNHSHEEIDGGDEENEDDETSNDEVDGDDDDDGDEEDEDEVVKKDANKLFSSDPVYTTGLILVVILSSGVIMIFAIFFIHRMKSKDEGSYTLASNGRISTIGYSLTKDVEYFA